MRLTDQQIRVVIPGPLSAVPVKLGLPRGYESLEEPAKKSNSNVVYW